MHLYCYWPSHPSLPVYVCVYVCLCLSVPPARLQGQNYQQLIVERREKLSHIACKGTVWTKNFGVEKQVRHKCFRKAYLVLQSGGIDLYRSKEVGV